MKESDYFQGMSRSATGCVASAAKGTAHWDNPFDVSDCNCHALGPGIVAVLEGSRTGDEMTGQRGCNLSLPASSVSRFLRRSRGFYDRLLWTRIDAITTQKRVRPVFAGALTR
jgi:hypothetical protein